jgi:hypothetical protein
MNQNNQTTLVPAMFLLLAASLASMACAPKMPPPQLGLPTGYDRLEEPRGAEPTPAGESVFETAPASFEPASVVPLDLLEGPNHRVHSVRLDHRFLYTYGIETPLGELEVVGRGLLRKRVLEVEALGAYQPTWVDGTKLFAFEVINEAAEPIEDTLQILRHPVRTVVNVPKGVVASFKALREMTYLGRTHREDDYYLEFLGLSGLKRGWAERMGLDPYSTNPYVKDRLNRYGLVSLAGSMTVRLATLPIPAGAASIVMSVVGGIAGTNEQLRDVAPEDIRVNSRYWLRNHLGEDGDLAKDFLEHPWYTPTDQNVIVSALAGLDGVERRDRFVELAVRADEAHEAYAFTRLALMLSAYDERRVPVTEIVTSHDLLLAHTADGGVVLPLYVDNGYWTAEVAAAEADIAASLDPERAAWGKVLLVSGQLSSRAHQEFETRGWEVVEGLEDLWLPEIDHARYQAKSPNPNRILPEFGRWPNKPPSP